MLGISSPNNYAIQTIDFIGEVVARYKIYGSPNWVPLLANKPTAEFQNVHSGDTELATY